MIQPRNELAEKAVTVLATAFVILGGVAASILLIVSNSSSPTNTLLYFAGGCLGAGGLLWILRDRDPLTPRAGISGWFWRPKPKTVHYEFAVRKPATRFNEPHPQPPTVERIREISQESLGTWVPSQLPTRRKSDQ